MKKNVTFLEAAHQVLQASGRPMTAAEILHAARSTGLISSEGKTPLKSLNARLAVDIIRFKSQSRFMRSDGSRYALRAWSNAVQEKIVPRRTVALVDEDVLAFDTTLLRHFVPEDGFKRDDDTHQELLASCFPVRRAEAEKRYDIIQLISVYIVRHFQSFLTYKRSRRLPEGSWPMFKDAWAKAKAEVPKAAPIWGKAGRPKKIRSKIIGPN
jgi:HB1, ASXL, restriction endonuclease HTH domain